MAEREAGVTPVITMLMSVEHGLRVRISECFTPVNIFNGHEYLMR